MANIIRKTIDDFGNLKRSDGLQILMELQELKAASKIRRLSAHEQEQLTERNEWLAVALQDDSSRSARRVSDFLELLAQLNQDQRQLLISAINLNTGHNIDVDGDANINIDSTVAKVRRSKPGRKG